MSGTTAGGFFAARFPSLAPHERIEVRTFRRDGRPGPRSWHADPLAAAAAALALPTSLAVYYGVCPRCQGGGKKEHVTNVPGLWADMDFKHFGDDPARTLAALDAFPLPPSWIVDSGGGLQPYWDLAAPLPIAGPDDPAIGRVEPLLARLYARLGGLDSVQDLSRILRVPGTLNHKYDPPCPVTIVRHDPGRRYTLEEVELLLPMPASPPSRPAIPGAPPRFTPRPGVPSPDDVRELLRHIPPTGDYKEDWLRVLAAVHSIYPGPEGEALCEEWSPGKPGEVERKFRSFGRYRGGVRGPAGAGTLYYLAKRHGWKPAGLRFGLTLRGVRYV